MAKSVATSQGLVARKWIRSSSQVIKIECEWIVENFSLKPQSQGQYLESSLFDDESDQTRKWKIRIYPKTNP